MDPAHTDQAFLTMIESNKGLIYKVARTYCAGEEDRKDLIQEIILQLWRSFGRYDDRYKLSTWIYKIALNVAISFYRKEKRRKMNSPDVPGLGAMVYRADEAQETTHENVQLLMRFIADLKEFDRALILLHLEGNDHPTIAEILGISVTNVSTKLHRIRQKLAARFDKLKNVQQ